MYTEDLSISIKKAFLRKYTLMEKNPKKEKNIAE